MATLGHFFFKKNPFSQPFFPMVARGEKKKAVGPAVGPFEAKRKIM